MTHTLNNPPKKSDRHLVADWVELACLLDEDGSFTGARFDQARGQADQVDASANSTPSDDDDPEATDRRTDEAYDVWRLLDRRATDFGAAYPFVVDSEECTLVTQGNDRMRSLYAFLLAASNLDVFHVEQGDLTSAFELASRHVVAALLPPSSVVEIFGTAEKKNSHRDRWGPGNLAKRLVNLAEEFDSSATTGAVADVSPYSSGDGGLDIVGFLRLSGPRSWGPVIFAQCACGKEWQIKQNEVAPSTWAPRFTKTFEIVPVTVIPYSYDNEDGGWASRWSIRGTLIDRRRWMQLMADRQEDEYGDVLFQLVDNFPGFAAAVL